MPYAFDPELVPYTELIPTVGLDEVIKRDAPPMDPAVLAEIEKVLPSYSAVRAVAVEDRRLPGGVRVRVYRPEAEEPLPALIYLHGGGFVSGDIDFFHVRSLRFADRIPAVVVTVDYRLAPEHPFPAGLEDALAAVLWAAAENGGPVAVGGDSAGAALATVCA
ncbi:MAG: esterase, partial [Nonomuraea muscovyensis]|nr:esterase [Nonomuraea muscovyensis]